MFNKVCEQKRLNNEFMYLLAAGAAAAAAKTL
jgi:hypothetical protein